MRAIGAQSRNFEFLRAQYVAGLQCMFMCLCVKWEPPGVFQPSVLSTQYMCTYM